MHTAVETLIFITFNLSCTLTCHRQCICSRPENAGAQNVGGHPDDDGITPTYLQIENATSTT